VHATAVTASQSMPAGQHLCTLSVILVSVALLENICRNLYWWENQWTLCGQSVNGCTWAGACHTLVSSHWLWWWAGQTLSLQCTCTI